MISLGDDTDGVCHQDLLSSLANQGASYKIISHKVMNDYLNNY